MKSALTSVPAGSYRACYEHLDAGPAWYRGSGPAPQRAAGRHVPGRIHLADQLLPAAVGDADAGGGGRRRQLRCRADHRVPAARHRGGRGRGHGRDQAVRLPDGARGRSGAARRAGPGHARTRAPGRHGERQRGARVRLRLVRRGHRRAHRQAASSRTARRRARPARRRLRRPGGSRAAGRGLARRTPPGRRGRGDGGRGRPAAAGGDPLAAGRARGTAVPLAPRRDRRGPPAAPGGWRAPPCGCR